jgi:hypothetical protein
VRGIGATGTPALVRQQLQRYQRVVITGPTAQLCDTLADVREGLFMAVNCPAALGRVEMCRGVSEGF